MKKFLSLIALIATFILATAFTDSVKAQVTKKIVMTSVNTSGDTATFSPIPSHINGFQATVTRLTGLMAGHVWLEGTIDGNWVKLDSFILSDQSINTKIFPVVRLSLIHI